MKVIINLVTTSKVPAMQYQCLTCIRAIILSKNLQINYVHLLEILMPITLNLFSQFFSASTLYPLIRLVTLLIEQAQKSGNVEKILLSIQKSNLVSILETKCELIRGALSEMFMILIISFS